MIIVDTSAVLGALVVAEPPPGLVERLAEDGDLHAPHLIDVEFLHALRRLNLTGAVSDERAEDYRRDFNELGISRYPHHHLADRIWGLRRNMTAYDAAFVALAETLGVPLVTSDVKLGRAPGHGAQIEVMT